MSSLRSVRSVVSSALCASLMVAQQPPPAAPNSPVPEVVFSVTTTRVQVDAVVTDSKGHYITDLTADDFAIYDDGKPQKITNFSYVSVSSGAPASSKTERKASPKSAPILPPVP